MAARNITLKFGELVSMPLKKASALQPKQEFINLCTGKDGEEHPPSPRRQPYHCESCGPITSEMTIVKGIKQGSDYIIVTQDEVTEAKETYSAEYKGVISLVAHPAADFLASTAPGKSVNHLIPASEAVAGQYKTLVAFIEEHPELVFVGLHTPVSVTNLYRVSVREGALVMEERVRSQEMKATPVVEGAVMDKLQMFLEMTLEDSLSPYSPDAYEDKYRMAMDNLAADSARLVAGAEGTAKATSAVGSSDADLMSKLAALNVEAPKKKKPAKKAAPKKKPAAKKAAPKTKVA